MVEKCIAWRLIETENREIYAYGIKNLLNILINLVSAIILGLVFDNLSQVIWFLVNFIPLRSYLGGYHLDNTVICYIASNVIIIVATRVATMIPMSVLVPIGIVCVAFIWKHAPINCPKRSYDKEEVKCFRKRCRAILLLELGVGLLLYFLDKETFIAIGLITIIIAGSLGIAEKMRGKKQ